MGLHLLANYAGQGWSAVMNIAFIPVYIRLLGVEAYGLVGVFAIVLTAATLLDGGMSATVNREMALYRAGRYQPQQIRNLLFSIELICLVIATVLLLLGIPLSALLARHWITSKTLGYDEISWSLYLMITAATFRIIDGVFRGALLGLQQHVLVNTLLIAVVTLRSAGVILPLVFWSASVETFFLWQAGVSALGVCAFLLMLRSKLPKASQARRFDRTSIYDLRRFAGGVLGAAALGVILTQIDKIMLVRLLPLAAFSPYAVAAAVAAGLYQVTNPVSQSYYPRLTEIYQSGDQGLLAATYHQAAQVVSQATAPASAFLIVFGRPLLELWTGNPALSEAAAPLLQLLAIGTMLHCAMYVPYVLQLASGWSKLAVQINSVAVLLFVPTLLILVPRMGLLGAAAAWAGLNICTTLTTMYVMHHRLLRGERWRWYVHDLLTPWAAALLVMTLLRTAYPSDASNTLKLVYLSAALISGFMATAVTLPVVRARLAAPLRRAGRGSSSENV